jgi:hypothetical protein
MNKLYSVVVILALVACLPACRQPKKVLTERDKQQVKDSVLAEVPKDGTLVQVNANFEDKVTLLGYTVNKQQVKPGDTVALTLYWKCEAKVDGDFKIFVHLDSSKSRKTYDHYAVTGLYPTQNWQPGEIVKDEMMMQLDKGFPGGPAKLWLGFFEATAWKDQKKNIRLKIKSPGAGRTDRQDRLLVTSFLIGTVAEKILKVRKTSAPVTVDGKLDDGPWKQAFLDAGQCHTPDGKPLPSGDQMKVALAYDDEKLYVAYDIKDNNLSSPYKDRDSTLWSGGKKGASDVAELFFDPDADGKNYLELQVSPANVIFDALFDGYRSPAWKKAAQFNMNFEHAVQVDGTLNDGKPDKGYTVEIAIPWKELPGFDKAPEPGRKFKVNMFRLSNSGGWAGAWAPVGNDFHDFALAGTVTFGN